MPSLYEKYVLPKVIHCVCGLKPMMRQRDKVVPQASGTVLELGIGSGLNLSYYDDKQVSHLIGIDPTPDMGQLTKRIDRSTLSVEFIKCGAEDLPIDDHQIDTVVATYTFCTIPDIFSAFAEVRRVLKPTGKLLFVEHGLAPDVPIQKNQHRINPIWRRIAGGCHLNRDIPHLMKLGGFKIDHLEEMYLPGWKPATFNVWGSAHLY